MKKYRIDTMNHTSLEFSDFEEAKRNFEGTKDMEMANVVDYDSYVELVESEDDFETERTIIRVEPVVDEQQHKDFGNPRDCGCDYDWWAKWEVVKIISKAENF